MNYQYVGKIVIPIILLGIAGIISMVINGDYQWLIATFIFWVLLCGLGIAVGFHRIYSHNCYKLKPWLDKIVLICGSLACQSSSMTWVSTHIGYHHPFSDTDRDPHTPTKGKFFAYIKWTLYVTKDTINHKYAVRLMRNKFHVWMHHNYFKFVWGSILAMLLIFGWKFTLYGYCIAAMLSIIQDNSVNLFGHWPKLGYRNFNTNDQSSNFPWLGYFGWGQGWHNNHHHAPRSFDFGSGVSGKWWEYDPCRIFIPLLKLGSIKE